MHARVCQALRPSDIIEQIWIRDVVDLVWEVFRLRRLRANLMAAAAYQGMLQILEPLFDAPGSFAKSWARREESAVQRVEAALAKAGLTMDAVAAASFSARIGDFERLDRLMTAAEGRRNAALHELERHRAGFALRLRRTLQDVEDAEFKVISPVEPVRRGGGMTSARKAEANRRNARVSTGPKTSAGKTRVAQNARRHGLKLPALCDPAWSGEIEALAREIAGADAGARTPRARATDRRRADRRRACAARTPGPLSQKPERNPMRPHGSRRWNATSGAPGRGASSRSAISTMRADHHDMGCRPAFWPEQSQLEKPQAAQELSPKLLTFDPMRPTMDQREPPHIPALRQLMHNAPRTRRAPSLPFGDSSRTLARCHIAGVGDTSKTRVE